MKTAAMDASQHTSLPAWHDAALKELVQEQKGFLALATITRSPLNEIAANQFFDTPDGIARLGFAIAHQLNASLPAVNGANDELLQPASSIANALANARRPVIVSGISCRSESVIKAAFDIAASLNTPERKAGLAYALPDCNSMGLAMMQASSFEKAAERLHREKDATVIIIENDLYRYMPPSAANAFFSGCKHLVVLDSLNSATTEKAHAVIPAATFAEGDGTLVNNEGRAQRYYQVFVPSNTNIQDSWKWLWKMQLLKTESANGQVPYPEELLRALESKLSQFNNISNVSPPHDFTIHGERIPREPHRYSGRTAMQAHLNVSEPKPLYDDDSALTFTMEGYKGLPPSGMTPFYWAPGWNSVQSLTKYQKEPGGTLKDGDPGIPLFNVKTGATPEFFQDIPEAFIPRQNKWLVLPQYDVLASGEFSSYTKGLRELSKQPYVFVSAEDARKLNVFNDAVLTLLADDNEYELPVKIVNEIKEGVLLVSAGMAGMDGINWGGWVMVGGR
jgi:NADH-quinone oxidoreductase subunit G